MKDLVQKAAGTAKPASQVIASDEVMTAEADQNAPTSTALADAEKEAKAKREKERADREKAKKEEEAKRQKEREEKAKQKAEAEKQHQAEMTAKKNLREAKKSHKTVAAQVGRLERELKREKNRVEKDVKTAVRDAEKADIQEIESKVNAGRMVGVPTRGSKAYAVLDAIRPHLKAAEEKGEAPDLKALVDMTVDNKEWAFARGLATVYVKASIERFDAGVPSEDELTAAVEKAEKQVREAAAKKIAKLEADLKSAQAELKKAQDAEQKFQKEVDKLTPKQETKQPETATA